MDIFFEIHKDLPREGPGDIESTLKAFSFLVNLPQVPLLLDIGCGPGKQTNDLASNTPARIVAMDTHRPFLHQMASKFHKTWQSGQVKLLEASMAYLPFPTACFDVIWSEGAIYNIGFENGLRSWKRYLKPGGCIAVTELSWLQAQRPNEIQDYWAVEYPGMHDVSGNFNSIEAAGYSLLANFTLPAASWWNDYYSPITTRLNILNEKYSKDPEALQSIASTRLEIDMHHKYSDYYGYIFYIMQAK